MTSLTPDELLFLQKYEQQRIKHNNKQKLYRINIAERVRYYNKHYYETKREKLKSIKRKIQKEPVHIDIDEIVATPQWAVKITMGGKNIVLNYNYENYNTHVCVSVCVSLCVCADCVQPVSFYVRACKRTTESDYIYSMDYIHSLF